MKRRYRVGSQIWRLECINQTVWHLHTEARVHGLWEASYAFHTMEEATEAVAAMGAIEIALPHGEPLFEPAEVPSIPEGANG